MIPSNLPVFQADLYRQRRAQLAKRIREQSGIPKPQNPSCIYLLF
jgi:hypothetical protein